MKPSDINIDLNTGYVKLDSTVTAGKFYIRGVGTLTDESTSTTSLVQDALLSRGTISTGVWSATSADNQAAGTKGKELKDAKDSSELASVK